MGRVGRVGICAPSGIRALRDVTFFVYEKYDYDNCLFFCGLRSSHKIRENGGFSELSALVYACPL